MIKIIISAFALMIISQADAQIKIHSGGNVALGSTSFTPASRLDVNKTNTTLSNIQTMLSYNSILNSSTYGSGAVYWPGLAWYTTDNNATKPKAGIWAYGDGSGSRLFFGTSNSYATGITNTAMVISPTGAVGLATTSPASMLSINGNGNALYQLYAFNSDNTDMATSIFGEKSLNTAAASHGYGLYGKLNNGSGTYGYGVLGISYDGSAGGGRAYGIYGIAGNATSGYNYGVYGILSGSNNGAGIYATISANGDYNVPGVYAAFFNGNIRTTDDTPEKPTGNSWTSASDGRLKKNIVDFKDGLNIIRRIRPVNYEMNGIGGFKTGLPYVGIVAQEVQQIAPYCIGKTRIFLKNHEKAAFANDIIESIKDDSTSESKYVAEILNYNPDGLFYAMINSIKQLDSIVTDLNNKLEKQQNGKPDEQGKRGFQIKLELANKEAILYQNEPNPFSNSTIIRYFIPDGVSGIYQIAFFDLYGKEIKKVEIHEVGFGALDLNTVNLSNGIYSYSLLLNGQPMETRKMIKNQ